MLGMISNLATGIDTNDASATASEILTGYTAYADNAKVSGSMPNIGAVDKTIKAGETYNLPEGYHNGNGKVSTASLSSETPATATAANIISGYTAWVNGIKLSGTKSSS